MASPPDIQPLILAAGQGRRLGRDKARIRLAGQESAERLIAACAEAGLERPPILVTGAYAEDHAGAPWAGGVRLVVNPRWAEGRSGSIAAGLEALSAAEQPEAWLLWPVDIPLPGAAVVAALAGALDRSSGAGRLWRPMHRGRRGHPILFHYALSPGFLALSPEASPRPMLRALPPEALIDVAVADPGILHDIDHPRDWRAARAALGEEL